MSRRLSASGMMARLTVALTLLGLFVFVLLPTFYLISFTFTRWSEIRSEVFENILIGDEHWRQIQGVLLYSLRIAVSVTLFDLVFGVPLAYLLARKKFRGKSVVEDLTTLPLVIPTSGFGFATLLTWTSLSGLGGLLGLGRGVVDQSYVIPVLNVRFLIFVVHVALTFPYIVRTLQAKFEQLDPMFEMLSRTLGASALTSFRKVVFPLSIPGVFSGSVLAFARSLGETGATLVVAGVDVTASIAIVRWEFQFKLAPAAFLGFLLIVIASALILPIELLVLRRERGFAPPMLLGVSALERRILALERFASKRLRPVKDVFSLGVLAVIVVVPILTVLNSVVLNWYADPFTGRPEGGVVYQLLGPSNYLGALLRATLTSLIVAGASTYLAVCIAIPTALVIERYAFGRAVRALLKIPLIVPTSALGLSMLILWGPSGLRLLSPGIWLITLTHTVFSVPVIVEPILATYEGAETEVYEETARTLGATPYDALEAVSLPLLKRGVLAGVILSFAHSLGETGATFIVMGRDMTVPTLVVTMVEALAIPAALFASTYLIAISLVLLAAFRIAVKR